MRVIVTVVGLYSLAMIIWLGPSASAATSTILRQEVDAFQVRLSADGSGTLYHEVRVDSGIPGMPKFYRTTLLVSDLQGWPHHWPIQVTTQESTVTQPSPCGVNMSNGAISYCYDTLFASPRIMFDLYQDQDLSHDGRVDNVDAGILFARWGTIPAGDPTSADINGDNVVDAADASEVFAAWTGSVVVIPEPSTALLGTLGVVVLFEFRLSANHHRGRFTRLTA